MRPVAITKNRIRRSTARVPSTAAFLMGRRVAIAAAVFACAIVAVQSDAAAKTGVIEVSGTTSTLDPGSTTCRLLRPYLVSCKTTSFMTEFSGALVGSSSTDNGVLIDCKTGRYHGEGVETFTGSVDGVGSGTLTWRLHLSGTVSADCSTITSFEGHGAIVYATGDLAGLRGTLRFEGSTYSGLLH